MRYGECTDAKVVNQILNGHCHSIAASMNQSGDTPTSVAAVHCNHVVQILTHVLVPPGSDSQLPNEHAQPHQQPT